MPQAPAKWAVALLQQVPLPWLHRHGKNRARAVGRPTRYSPCSGPVPLLPHLAASTGQLALQAGCQQPVPQGVDVVAAEVAVAGLGLRRCCCVARCRCCCECLLGRLLLLLQCWCQAHHLLQDQGQAPAQLPHLVALTQLQGGRLQALQVDRDGRGDRAGLHVRHPPETATAPTHIALITQLPGTAPLCAVTDNRGSAAKCVWLPGGVSACHGSPGPPPCPACQHRSAAGPP